MNVKTSIENFIDVISSSINEANKECMSKEYSFLINNFKIDIPCILEYDQGDKKISVSSLDKELIKSKTYDPCTIGRIQITGTNFTELVSVNNEK